jgi:hypothetical protein
MRRILASGIVLALILGVWILARTSPGNPASFRQDPDMAQLAAWMESSFSSQAQA